MLKKPLAYAYMYVINFLVAVWNMFVHAWQNVANAVNRIPDYLNEKAAAATAKLNAAFRSEIERIGVRMDRNNADIRNSYSEQVIDQYFISLDEDRDLDFLREQYLIIRRRIQEKASKKRTGVVAREKDRRRKLRESNSVLADKWVSEDKKIIKP